MIETGLQRHRIYIDESGFNLWTRRNYGRARLGERVNRIVGGQRGRNVTVIAAISDLVGVVYHEVHTVAVTKEIFVHFIASLSAILGEESAILLMDNAPVHSSIQERFPNLSVKFLPPYSPFLNPIKNVFSVLKAYIKQYLHEEVGGCTPARAAREGRTFQQLREMVLLQGIDTALPQITQNIVANNYSHANTYLARCIEQVDLVA